MKTRIIFNCGFKYSLIMPSRKFNTKLKTLVNRADCIHNGILETLIKIDFLEWNFLCLAHFNTDITVIIIKNAVILQ